MRRCCSCAVASSRCSKRRPGEGPGKAESPGKCGENVGKMWGKCGKNWGIQGFVSEFRENLRNLGNTCEDIMKHDDNMVISMIIGTRI